MDSAVDDVLHCVSRITRHIPRDNPSMAILSILIEIGFPSHFDGFGYLREAILIRSAHKEMRLSAIYEKIAEIYNNTVGYAQIDQAIRDAIKYAWTKGNQEKWDHIYPERLTGNLKRPSNLQLICYFASIIELWGSVSEESFDESE